MQLNKWSLFICLYHSEKCVMIKYSSFLISLFYYYLDSCWLFFFFLSSLKIGNALFFSADLHIFLDKFQEVIGLNLIYKWNYE